MSSQVGASVLAVDRVADVVVGAVVLGGAGS